MPITKKISQLESTTEVISTDLMEISKDQGNGSYLSRKIKISDLTKSKLNDIPSNTYVPVEKKYTDTIYQITTNDDYIRVAATDKGIYSLVLPVTSGSGKTYIIKNVAKRNNTFNTDVFITTTGSDVIDSYGSSYKLRFGEYFQIIDGSVGTWDIISKG